MHTISCTFNRIWYLTSIGILLCFNILVFEANVILHLRECCFRGNFLLQLMIVVPDDPNTISHRHYKYWKMLSFLWSLPSTLLSLFRLRVLIQNLYVFLIYLMFHLFDEIDVTVIHQMMLSILIIWNQYITRTRIVFALIKHIQWWPQFFRGIKTFFTSAILVRIYKY